MSKYLNNEYLKEQANKIHNNFYSYEKFKYINYKTKSIITCPEHGDYLQDLKTHLQGFGCPKCTKIKDRERHRKLSLIKIENKYAKNRFSYLGPEKDKEKIQCNIHNIIFYGRITMHKGCTECLKDRESLSHTLNFIRKSNKIHNNYYNYTEMIYSTSTEKITIICPIHKEFQQYPNDHIRGGNCPKCARQNSPVFSFKQFEEKCNIKTKKGCFYILRCFNDNEEFYKLGITTNNIKQRYTCKRDMPYNFEIIHEIFDTPLIVWNLEINFKNFIKLNKIHYIPSINFSGYKSECFNVKFHI